LIGAGEYKKALATFKKFVAQSGSVEEKYLAYHRLSGIMAALNDINAALDYEWEAIKLRPEYPDAWAGMGALFYSLGEFNKAVTFLVHGLTKDRSDSIIVFNPRDYDANPLKLLANCYWQMGKPDKALKVVQKVCSIFPKDRDSRDMLKMLEKTTKELKEVDLFIERVQEMTDAELAVELESLPEDMKMHPKVCIIRNEKFRKTTTSGKDIAYYCGNTSEEWGPSSDSTGIGGSEEAVLNLTRRWVKEGYNVTVYNNCGSKAITDKHGVRWEPFWNFNPRSKMDTLIIWRNPAMLDHKFDAKTVLLDMHDVMNDIEFTPDRLENVTKVMVKTAYHGSLFPSVPKEKLAIVGNGVDLRHFSGASLQKKRNSMIYTSSADRGLEHLLDRWSDLKTAVPDATLDIYYGWAVFDALHADDPSKMKWKDEMIAKMRQPGISVHGRVGHREIAMAMRKADVFAYPCHFEEIFCISAVKAQAAKCKCVTTNYAALPEVVDYGLLALGEIDEESTWDSWLEVLIGALRRDPFIKSANGHYTKTNHDGFMRFSWDHIAKEWVNLM